MTTYKHGLTGYTYHKCRCDTCVQTWATYQHAYHQKNKDRLLALSKARYERRKPEVLARKKRKNESPAGRVRSSEYVSARRARLMGALVENVNREVLFERDHVCKICGEPIDFDLVVDWIKGESSRTADCPTTDHIIPLSKGGEHSYANCQMAHWSCNLKKHAKL